MKWGDFRVRPQFRFYLVVALILVTLVTGMSTGFTLFFRLVYVLALTVVFSYLLNWLTLKRLHAASDRRTMQAEVGDAIEEEITVHNLSRVPKHALEVQEVTNLPGYTGGIVTSLFGSGKKTLSVKLPARKRGEYLIGPTRISNVDPFGMFRRERLFGDADTVLIFPRTYNLPEFDIPPAELTGDSSVRRRSHNVTPHASTIRDYAPGDSLSRVHWMSTARLGKLMSKEFDLGRAAEMWVVVDLHRDVQAGELEESTDEYAASIAASLARRHVAAGLPVGLVAYGDKRYFLSAETGTGQFERIMEFLALGKAEGSTPLEVLLANEEPLWSHLSTVLVITSSPRAAWVTALRELSRRGVRVIVVLVAAESFGASFKTLDLLEHTAVAGLPAYVIRKGDDIPSALARGRDRRVSITPSRGEGVGRRR